MESNAAVAVRVVSNLPPWLVGPGATEERRLFPWSREETAVLKRWWGRIARAELAERVSEVLRRRTEDPQARRTVSACAVRATVLGLEPYQGEADEMNLRWAARLAGIPYHRLHVAAREGLLATTKKGKQRYVKAGDWEVWLAQFREREATQARALQEIREETISKREAMALTGLRETHLLRYLASGVIRAWKIPDRGERRNMGYWLVSRASAREYVTARAEGRLSEILNGNPAYVAIRAEMVAEVREIRRAGRLGRRDPLTEPKSHYHPGCFTVAQVASAVGLSAQVVYEAIGSRTLQAVSVTAGGRARYAVEPWEARRYAGWVAEREQAAKRWHNSRRRAIAAAGLLTVRDLAERWGVSETTAHARARRGLPRRQWGRYLVFEVGDVERFEALTAPPNGRGT